MKKKIFEIIILILMIPTNLWAQWSNPNFINGNLTINGGYLNLGDFSSDPSNIPDGTIWYNTTSNTIKIKQNGTISEIGSGGSGGMAIGDPVTSCTANSVPFCNAAGNLDQTNPGLTYDSVAETFEVAVNSGVDTLMSVRPSGVIINGAAGNYDFAVNGDTVANLLLCDASTDTVSVAGNTVLGDASADSVISNAATWSFPNDTTVSLGGGVNGINFDSNTLSIDATNNRVGIGTDAPLFTADVTGIARVQTGSDVTGFTLPATGDILYVSGNTGAGSFGLTRYNVNSAFSPSFQFFGAKGTPTTPTAAGSNEAFASSVYFAGRTNASTWAGGINLVPQTTEAWTSTANGSRLEIRFNNPGTTAAANQSFDIGLPNGFDTTRCGAANAIYGSTATCLRSTVSIGSGQMVEGARVYTNGGASTAAAPSFANAIDADSGMYFPSAGQIGFSANSAQTMLIDASGNVCIGTDTTPDAKLDLEGTLKVTGNMDLQGVITSTGSSACVTGVTGEPCFGESVDVATGGDSFVRLQAGTTGTTAGVLEYTSTGSLAGYIGRYFGSTYAAITGLQNKIVSTVSSATQFLFGASTNIGAGTTIFAVGDTISTAPVELFTIDGEGNTLITGDTTLGDGTTGDTVTARLADNTASAIAIKQSTNEYLKINTTDGSELIEFGTTPSIKFSNTNLVNRCTLDGLSPSTCSGTVLAGVECQISVKGSAASHHECVYDVTGTTITLTCGNSLTNEVNWFCYLP